MGSIKKWTLGAALAIATLGLSSSAAHAAHIGVYVGVRGPVAYVPPCPGPGYAWVAGYWANGYWTPGYWNFVGVGVGRPFIGGRIVINRGPVYYHRDFDRHFAPEHFHR